MHYTATVHPGHGRGDSEIGYPTLNCTIPSPFNDENNQPYSHGIYAGWIWVDGVQHPAAIHFGPIPLFDLDTPSLEIYVMDTRLPSRPASVEFEIVQHIRDIIDFDQPADLTAQINQDIIDIKAALDL